MVRRVSRCPPPSWFSRQAGTDKGSYSQGDGTLANDNNLQPISGLSLESGTYSGTLQYTITG